MRRFGPKTADHPSIGIECPACRRPFAAGDYTTLIALGPGDDEEAREKARRGMYYNAVAVEVHWDCADHGPWTMDNKKKCGFAFLPGTDVGGPVYDGSPCIVCGKPVAPGEGAQAIPPLPALHTTCLRTIRDGTRPR